MSPEPDARARLLQEATRLFSRQGYDSTSVREIVEAAGVTKPTLYYYFESKEGLFHALVREHFQAGLAGWEALLEGQGRVLDRLEALVRARTALIRQDPCLVRFLARIGMTQGCVAGFDPSEFFAQESRLLACLFAEGIQSGELRPLDPSELAMTFLGQLHFRVAASVHGGPELSDASIDQLLDVFKKGVSP